MSSNANEKGSKSDPRRGTPRNPHILVCRILSCTRKMKIATTTHSFFDLAQPRPRTTDHPNTCAKSWKRRHENGSSTAFSSVERPQERIHTKHGKRIQHLLLRSCMRSASEVDSGEDSNDEFYPIHFPTVSCVLVITNHQGYLREFETAIAKLESDGLVFEMTHEDESHTAIQSAESSNELISTVRKVERVMELCSHALYGGHIYARPNQTQLTYAKLMDVSSYLNKLLANDAISKHLLKHFKNVENILARPACKMIHQLEFDYNLIKVSNGFCFNISQRAFVSVF